MKPTHHAGKTVSSSAVDISTEFAAAVAKHAATNRAEVNVVDNPIRYTLDGTTPTATVGIKAPAGSIISLQDKKAVNGFKAIAESTDAEVEIAFFTV